MPPTSTWLFLRCSLFLRQVNKNMILTLTANIMYWSLQRLQQPETSEQPEPSCAASDAVGTPAATPRCCPQAVCSAFVEQYYNALYATQDEVHKFYQDTSTMGRAGSDGVMEHVTTLPEINKKVMSVDYNQHRTDIVSADAVSSHNGSVFIVVTGSLTTADGGVCQRFMQSFFLAPHKDAGYFVWSRRLGGGRSVRSIGGLGEVGGEPEQEEDGVLPRRSGDGEEAAEASVELLRVVADGSSAGAPARGRAGAWDQDQELVARGIRGSGSGRAWDQGMDQELVALITGGRVSRRSRADGRGWQPAEILDLESC